jgi:hypothetical protein
VLPRRERFTDVGGILPAAYKAGLDLAIERGWLEMHESGTFVRLLKTAGAN